MQVADFIRTYSDADLTERSVAQSHFNDLCAMLGEETPVVADPKGEWFTFEKGVGKTTGGKGWADVWRKGCFGWEYKGKRKNLDAAFVQLQQYAVALENPLLLIVSDIDRILIHTNWTNTVAKTHEIALEDLKDASTRDLLKNAFTHPERLKPAKTRQMLTEQAARKFADLAQRLRERGNDAETVAHFVNRLVFCMFAEDVKLLPNHMFRRMLEGCRKDPEEFKPFAKTLFGAMRKGGMVGFERVEWFNGGLFDNDHALDLDHDDIADVLEAARLDWSDIDPSILGTLFERGLDPTKRSQLGAHYTDRDKIMQIIEPVVVRPLLDEWGTVRAKIDATLDAAPKATKDKLLRGAALAQRTKALKSAERAKSAFLKRLKGFRILDPACGSGNFLNLALLAVKDIEHRVNLDCEAMGLERGFPQTGPENVLGIELNPYAAELARVSVWIGEIQWMRRNGFPAASNPILRPLDTIECRDAVLGDDGTPAEWPDADAIVGNPPFLGNKKMVAELGEDYATRLRKAWSDVPGGVDLVTYWFAKAWAMIEEGRTERAGLVSTNSIRGGANRAVLKPIVAQGRIFNARSDEEWTVDGAAVRVSLVSFDAQHGGAAMLDGEPATEVYSDLTTSDGGTDITGSARLSENKNISFQGPVKVGPFDIQSEIARDWLLKPVNPHGKSNEIVLRPWTNGMDITRRPSN